MRNMKRRIIAVLLILAMMFGMFPVNAFEVYAKEPVKPDNYKTRGEATLCASINLQGAAMKEGFFALELIDMNEGSSTYGESIATARNSVSESVQEEVGQEIESEAICVFPTLCYTQDDAGKTFHYRVVMVNEEKEGYTYDSEAYDIYVDVTASDSDGDGDGYYDVDDEGFGPDMAVVAHDENGNDMTEPDGRNMIFETRYEASGSVMISSSVEVDGCELEEGMFPFELYKYDPESGETVGDPLQTNSNMQDGSIEIEIVCDQDDVSLDSDNPSCLYYAIRMVDEEKPGYVYDSEDKIVVVTPTDNGDGTLTVTVNEPSSKSVFRCVYTAGGTAEIGASVSCGEGALNESEFSFQLCDAEGKVLQTVGNQEEGNIVFEPLSYNQYDAGKTYTYYVKQVEGDNPQIVYDKSIKEIKVKVSNEGEGKLSTEIEGQTVFTNRSIVPETDETGVYCLSDAKQLLWFAEQVNAGQTSIDAKLTGDIDLSGMDWTMMESYEGTFDGNCHVICGLNSSIDLGNEEKGHGFIRTLTEDGSVKNLTFTDSKVFNHEGNGAISAVIVYTNNGKVENCVVKNSEIQHGAYDAIGVVAGVNNKEIYNCASISNTVKRVYGGTGNKPVSGLVWSNGANGTIQNCINYDCTYVDGSENYAFTSKNDGEIRGCFYYEPEEQIENTGMTEVTAQDFASGKIAHQLNNVPFEGTLAWGQNLDNGKVNPGYPVWGDATVYRGYISCASDAEIKYTNDMNAQGTKPDHSEGEDVFFTAEGEKEPTCVERGIGHTECVLCNETVRSNISVSATGHVGETEVRDTKKATCSEEGYTGDVYCMDCGGKVAEGETVEKQKHIYGKMKFNWSEDGTACQAVFICKNDTTHISTENAKVTSVVKKAATCKENGVRSYTATYEERDLKYSGMYRIYVSKKNVDIPATGHIGEKEVVGAKDATCNEEGYTGDVYCVDCGDKLADSEIIPKTNKHRGGTATCKNKAICDVCKKAYGELSKNHTWDSGVVTKKPTAVEKGEKTYACKVCKVTKKEGIAALGAPKKGAIAKSDKATYKVTKSDLKNVTAAYVGPLDKAATKVTIPATVKIDGVTFKVTSVEKNAFKNNKKVKTVIIGKNVTTIGSKAFYGCSKLKTLKIQTTKLTEKKIGSKAFGKTPKSMKVTVPKKKFKTYKSMLIKKGVNKKAKFKKG